MSNSGVDKNVFISHTSSAPLGTQDSVDSNETVETNIGNEGETEVNNCFGNSNSSASTEGSGASSSYSSSNTESPNPTEESDEGIDNFQDNQYQRVYVDGSKVSVLAHQHNWLTKFLLRTSVRPVPEERTRLKKSFLKNPFSVATWNWVSPVLRTGFSRILEIKDIYLIPEDEMNEVIMSSFRNKLKQYKNGTKRVKYAEFYAILYAVRYWLLNSLISACFFVAGALGMSLISRALIQKVEDIYMGEAKGHGQAVGYAIAATIIQFCYQYAFIWNNFKTRYFAEIMRTVTISAVYDKLMRLSPEAKQLYPAGRITSLLTTDTHRIFLAARWTSMVIVFGPAFGGIVAILVVNLGASGLVGCGLVLLGIVCNLILSKVVTSLRKRSLPFADRRISLVRETVEHMRVIKFYGWEVSFVKLVSAARKRETDFLKILGIVEGTIDAFLISIPQFGGVLSFAVRIITSHNLTPAMAFPSLTLFQLFVSFSMMFGTGITSHADALVSVKRLEEFFTAPEDPSYVMEDVPGKVTISHGFFNWVAQTDLDAKQDKKRFAWKSKKNTEDEDSEKTPLYTKEIREGAKKFPGLLDINLEINPKELVYVVGSIGSGKSTLLSGILGTIPKLSGTVTSGGSSSAVMTTWCQNATIRDNILFGKPYNRERYLRTLFVCCLEPDLDNLPGRDLSEIGERGITLSGGQKARIALARCVYAGGDVILLDDILSAVDSKVANHILKYCIRGELKNSTRIIATHNLKLIGENDTVIYMTGEGSMKIGKMRVLEAQEPAFYNLLQMTKVSDEEDESDAASIDGGEEAELEDMMTKEAIADTMIKPINIDLLEKVGEGNETSKRDSKEGSLYPLQTNETKEAYAVKLMQKEKRAVGRVPAKILIDYIKSGSRIGLMILVVLFIVQACVAATVTMQSVFLQFWTANKFDEPSGFYIGIYCLIVGLNAIAYMLLIFFVSRFCYNSSSSLHDGAIARLYKAPMSYFDTTPLGRIINRFTDDVSSLDTQMFALLGMMLFSSGVLLASLITVFIYVPWTILAIIPTVTISFMLYNYYRISSIELKRINSIFRGVTFSLLSESVSGLPVIIGYNRTDEFKNLLSERIDNMNISFQVNLASQYWLALRVSTPVLCVTLVVTLLSAFQIFHLDVSRVGMLLSLVPSLSTSIINILPNFVDLENQLNSVERLHEMKYNVPQEAPSSIPENAPPSSWPANGAIEFKHVSMKYRDDLPLTLDDVNFEIKGGERIGICGRTGAGKSTILTALFRLAEINKGQIIIDGIDVSQIGLTDLRSKLSIIPQEPILFQGTIRSNLDPFSEKTDDELWSALRRAGAVKEEDFMKLETSANSTDINERSATLIVHNEHKFHLDARIDSNGENFSLGERQLLALARALVRNPKILVLDEATAAVDVETDQLIQDTVAKEFSECTILCIAHRLQTIAKYDKVLVMSAGRVGEMGTPRELFEDKNSDFHGMCEEFGLHITDFN
ncbi:ATP-binding cassette transporter [Starmerella bacillaris]|uniref:ATP-binding cassette transporter n=1 Tax=Starmerella bacillaris TaxID=1247836 RepID=A0AAV5RMN7_STABA|nr:ATP-binding cassette transporter [Starmerella bacillaris]